MVMEWVLFVISYPTCIEAWEGAITILFSGRLYKLEGAGKKFTYNIKALRDWKDILQRRPRIESDAKG